MNLITLVFTLFYGTVFAASELKCSLSGNVDRSVYQQCYVLAPNLDEENLNDEKLKLQVASSGFGCNISQWIVEDYRFTLRAKRRSVLCLDSFRKDNSFSEVFLRGMQIGCSTSLCVRIVELYAGLIFGVGRDSLQIYEISSDDLYKYRFYAISLVNIGTCFEVGNDRVFLRTICSLEKMRGISSESKSVNVEKDLKIKSDIHVTPDYFDLDHYAKLQKTIVHNWYFKLNFELGVFLSKNAYIFFGFEFNNVEDKFTLFANRGFIFAGISWSQFIY